MAVIKTRHEDGDATDVPTTLAEGELAVNTQSKKLWVGPTPSGGAPVLLSGGGGVVEPGTADGQTLRWEADNSAWEATSDLVVSDAGNVGIGTTNPARPLDIVYDADSFNSASITNTNAGTSAMAALRLFNDAGSVATIGFSSSNYSAATFGGTPSALAVRCPSGSPFMVLQGNNERMRITSGGNVGIGTDSPAEKLEIADNARLAATPTIRITNTDQFAAATNVVGSLEFFSKDLSQPNIITGYVNNISENAGTNYALTLGTASNANATEHMRITSTGNVGIGTDNPYTALHVLSESAPNNIAQVIETDQSQTFINFRGSSSGSTQVRLGLDANNLVAYTNSLERMRIDSSGNVLVGMLSQNDTSDGFSVRGDTAKGQVYAGASSRAPLKVNRVDGGQYVADFFSGSVAAGRIQVTAGGGGTPSFTSGSDAALKQDIVDMGPQLEAVNALRPVDYTLIATGARLSGFVAQDVEKVWPHKVSTDERNNLLQLTNMSDTDARLIKAIQEQQSLIAELTARVEQLES